MRFWAVSSSRRRRSEFWLSGNDIDEEGVWEWARTRLTVPEFGWTEEPFDSPEENCLAWTITAERRGSSDGWHPSSCCNNLQYICQLWDGLFEGLLFFTLNMTNFLFVIL